MVIKSVYDPSPVGYSLPASNAFTGFATTGNNTNNSAEFNVKGNFNKGWYFYRKQNKQGETVFFPASGCRYSGTGSLNVVSTYGYCWVSGPYNRNYGRYLYLDSDNVYPLNYAYRSYGFPVRSAEEMETHKFNLKQEMDDRYYNLWSTDNDKIVPNDEVVIKSVYDPSPVGYSLPASNAFTGFTTTGQKVGDWSEGYILTPEEKEKLNVKGDFDKGYYFYTKPNKQGYTFFFPASGWRYHNPGALNHFSKVGHYWSAGVYYTDTGRNLGFAFNYILSLNNSANNLGVPVRSAEEKKWRCVVWSYNVQTSAALHPPHARRGSPPFMMSWMTQSHIATPTTHKKINALKFINSRNINR